MEEEIPSRTYTVQDARAVPPPLTLQRGKLGNVEINYIDIPTTTEQHIALTQYSLDPRNGPFLQDTYKVWAKLQRKEQEARKRAEDAWGEATKMVQEANHRAEEAEQKLNEASIASTAPIFASEGPYTPAQAMTPAGGPPPGGDPDPDNDDDPNRGPFRASIGKTTP